MLELPNRSFVDRNPPSKKKKKKTTLDSEDDDCKFIGNPVSADEAKARWSHRYLSKSKWAMKSAYSSGTNEKQSILHLQARCHYREALVDGVVIKLFDDVYIQGEEGKKDYVAKIVEFFETVDEEPYLTAQWFYRAEDTVIQQHSNLIDNLRVFFSEIKDDNPLGCIVRKVKIAQIGPNVSNEERRKKIECSELYCDMRYSLPYLTFANLINAPENEGDGCDTSSTISSESNSNNEVGDISSSGDKDVQLVEHKTELTLLDLYSGCGAMSTGLCLGASLSGSKLVTRWAVDMNPYACESLGKNHPESQVRNEKADDFLSLLKEWEKLCKDVLSSDSPELDMEGENSEEDNVKDSSLEAEEFEVESLLDICYGDPNYVNKPGLYFKVRWKGYGPDEDTWEPIDGLSTCKERIKEFVKRGQQSKLLPLPGDVDFICGGPPCQGVSGFNRFRDKSTPLKDPKNHQLVVFMDIVDYLKPKHVLMENVVDILKFADGFLGRYAVGRLVGMNYQARMGIMAAGSYGLPQFRLRVFLWGAHTSKKLPQYPLPTHEVVTKGGVPNEFEEIYVSHGKKGSPLLEKALLLKDAISDLPSVTNFEDQDEMPYDSPPHSEFQRLIRFNRADMVSLNGTTEVTLESALYDHRPLKLNDDDYQRVCQIPKHKGANFRNLPGLRVNEKNKVELDPTVERVYLPSKKPLVPDYAISFVRGISTKPFGRLWWDETVGTVVTRAEPHNQAVLHPEQDRVLTIRENARLQGFLDCYKLHGPVKERYIQVGNAVAMPVAAALGYAFGKAITGLSEEQPLTTLPVKYPQCIARNHD